MSQTVINNREANVSSNIIEDEVKLWAAMYNKTLSDMHDEFGTVQFLEMCGLSAHKIKMADLILRGANIHKVKIGDPMAEYVITQGICISTFLEFNTEEIYEYFGIEEDMIEVRKERDTTINPEPEVIIVQDHDPLEPSENCYHNK